MVVGGKDIAGKECALITCCEEDDMSVMDGVRIPIERMAALNKWKMAGEVLIPGVLNVGENRCCKNNYVRVLVNRINFIHIVFLGTRAVRIFTAAKTAFTKPGI